MNPFIYALVEPNDKTTHVRYVGMAFRNKNRPYDHAIDARRNSGKNSHLLNWIQKLQKQDLNYGVIKLEELSEQSSLELVGFVEKCYIKSLRELGHKLINITEGGEGRIAPLSEETKDKIGYSNLGQVRTAEQRLRISAANRKNWETRSHKFNDNTKDLISNSLIGNTRCLGYKHTEQTKQKMREGQLRRRKRELLQN